MSCAQRFSIWAEAGEPIPPPIHCAFLGPQQFDKKNDGLSKGHCEASIYFDRQSSELLPSEEIPECRMRDCIIFISGEKPIYDKKLQYTGYAKS